MPTIDWALMRERYPVVLGFELLGESPVLSIPQGGLNRYLGFSLYASVIECCHICVLLSTCSVLSRRVSGGQEGPYRRLIAVYMSAEITSRQDMFVYCGSRGTKA